MRSAPSAAATPSGYGPTDLRSAYALTASGSTSQTVAIGVVGTIVDVAVQLMYTYIGGTLQRFLDQHTLLLGRILSRVDGLFARSGHRAAAWTFDRVGPDGDKHSAA